MKTVLVIANEWTTIVHLRMEILESLLKENYRVVAALPVCQEAEPIRAIGCELVNLDVDRRGKNPLKDLNLLKQCKKLIRECKPDVVLTYTVKPNVYGGLSCRLAHIPYITTITGLGTTFEQKGLLKSLVVFLYRLGLKKASAVMFQNKTNMALFQKLHIGRNYHLVSGSGVNLEQHSFEPYPAESSPIHMTFVGRIMRDKGICELLEAAQAIKQTHPDVQIDLIGGFDEAYQSAVQEAADAGIVNYLGSQKEMHPFYSQSWAVLMPSYHEGISNVCLEAAATGRPVLASKVPGCQETFDDGVTGLGFAAKSADELRGTIEKFLALPHAQKAQMGRAGREKMEREFDRRQVIAAYMTEINSIAKDKK